jgi:glycosyltransferase involved in cell wall biosynthesis
MARILFTIPNFMTAGSGRAMLNVIERLDRSQFDPHVCVARAGGDLYREAQRQGIPVIEAAFTVAPRPALSLPLRVLQAARTFRPYGFDLWHSFHYLDDYTEPLVAKAAGAKAWIYTKKNMNWWRRSWRIRTWLASGVAAQNTSMLRDFFPAERNRKKAVLIPPGVDHSRYHPAAEARLRLRDKLGISREEVVAVSVAHIVPVKGLETLLRAAALVPGLHVWLAGSPQDRGYTDSLERLSRDLGIAEHVHFLGAIRDIPALLVETDIFVLSSVSKGEGCPVALLEAMSAGVASIATDVPGCNDVIQSEVNGLLTPSGDAEALASRLTDLAESAERRATLGAAARQRIESNYTMAREVSGYQELYRRVLAA